MAPIPRRAQTPPPRGPPRAIAPLRHIICTATATPALSFLAKHLPAEHTALPVGRTAAGRTAGHLGHLQGGGELAGDAHGTLDQREQLQLPRYLEGDVPALLSRP